MRCQTLIIVLKSGKEVTMILDLDEGDEIAEVLNDAPMTAFDEFIPMDAVIH